jgi:hypothetical protein
MKLAGTTPPHVLALSSRRRTAPTGRCQCPHTDWPHAHTHTERERDKQTRCECEAAPIHGGIGWEGFWVGACESHVSTIRTNASHDQAPLTTHTHTHTHTYTYTHTHTHTPTHRHEGGVPHAVGVRHVRLGQHQRHALQRVVGERLERQRRRIHAQHLHTHMADTRSTHPWVQRRLGRRVGCV